MTRNQKIEATRHGVWMVLYLLVAVVCGLLPGHWWLLGAVGCLGAWSRLDRLFDVLKDPKPTGIPRG